MLSFIIAGIAFGIAITIIIYIVASSVGEMD